MDYKIFGYWDTFNEYLYKNADDAKQAIDGGNLIIPLYIKCVENLTEHFAARS